jgi:signal transduction histidine kinase
MTLAQLLASRRQELLARWAAAARASFSGVLTPTELIDRMPVYLEELIRSLSDPREPHPEHSSPNAEEHGVQRLRLGFDIGKVVREYGLLHAAILELAAAEEVAITTTETRMLALALNEGTCDAVTQYQWQRDSELQRQAAEHLGFIAHELRNPLATARTAYSILQRQQPEPSRTAEKLDRSLAKLGSMIDNALSHAWLKVGAPLHGERVDLAALIREIEQDVADEGAARGITIVTRLEPIVMQADPRLLSSAISNLVRNALKFGKRDTTVIIRSWRQDARVLIEVEDGCGGLPPGKPEELFSPFVQKGTDRTGFGLGLAIARQAAESHNGTLGVRNLPGQGCVFKIDLPDTPVAGP